MYDNLPPGTTDADRDAPWNEPADDNGDAEAHGIEMVCGGDTYSMLETFSEFIASASDEPEKLIEATDFWLRPLTSNADLLKIALSGDRTHRVFAALDELRARYLASPYTQRVIASHADDWVKEQREIMAEGA